MRRPRWIGVLLIALAIAAGFAYLGKWQLTRAVEARQVGPQITETVHPLEKVLHPGTAIANDRVGQLVTVSATTVPADYTLIQDRDNNSGRRGWWVVGHAIVSEGPDAGAHLAVARGFTASRAVALETQRQLAASDPETLELSGRIQPTDPPEQPEDSLDGDPPMMKDMAVAILINHWTALGDSPKFFEAYLVATNHVPHGLVAIYSPPPIQQKSIDWLNAFYAAEWAVFAGFAVYLWYRLTKDAWEREIEDLELARQEAAGEASDQSTATQKVD
jgi:cytochrome oxidase assembly protein ShyY1